MKSLIIVAGFLLVAILSWTLPHFLIGTGVNSFEGESREFAEYAVKASRQLVGGSLEPLVVTAYRVSSVNPLPDTVEEEVVIVYSVPPVNSSPDTIEEGCGEFPHVVRNRYTATVLAYTAFGIPYATIEVGCKTTVISRRGWVPGRE